MWFLHQMQPQGASYNLSLALHLRGKLDPHSLEQALLLILQRHEVLRSRFSIQDGVPVQTTGEAPERVLRVEDYSGAGGEGADWSVVERRAQQEIEGAFDLGRGPLLRALVLLVGPEEQVLVVVMHHIASDGWSQGVLSRELGEAYSAYRRGEQPKLEALGMQYWQYAQWQRGRLEGEELRGLVEWWKGKLAGLTVTELEGDYGRPALRSCRGGTWRGKLGRELTEKLVEVGRGHGATMFMTMLAAFMVLLHRWIGQEEVVVGCPTANRTRGETEGLIGLFVNMLVMRLVVSGEMSFTEVVRRVREEALESWAHQELPFEKLVEEMAPRRDPGRNPLFQIAFAVQNTPSSIPGMEGLEVFDYPTEDRTTRFDLEVYLFETAQGLELRALYAAELFAPSTIESLFDSYQQLLIQVASEPTRTVMELELVSPAQRQQLGQLGRGRRSEYPREATVQEQFEAQVRRDPEALALEYEGRRMSYGQLNERANQVAWLLKEHGVGRQTLVGVCMERGLDLVVGLLGVLKAGGAYVPLDPGYPSERLGYMVKDSGVKVILSQEKHLGVLSGENEGAGERVAGGPQVICLDRDAALIERQGKENCSGGSGGKDLVYVIYTSGSSGRPKGVMIEHRGVSNLMSWHRRAFGLSAKDRGTLLAGLSFDASAWELWPYLGSGAAVVIPREAHLESPQQVLRWLARVKASVTFLPTPVAELVFEETMPTGLELRVLLTGGEKLHRAPPSGLGFEVVNNYGPTECSVVSTWGWCVRGRHRGGGGRR